MKDENNSVQEEMRKLISKSCARDQVRNSKAYHFQKSVLKFFFGVADVTIDYDAEIITLWNSSKDNPRMIYSLAEAKASKIRYTSLEETLKGCLEEGDEQRRFYRSMLSQYNPMHDASLAFMSA